MNHQLTTYQVQTEQWAGLLDGLEVAAVYRVERPVSGRQSAAVQGRPVTRPAVLTNQMAALADHVTILLRGGGGLACLLQEEAAVLEGVRGWSS